MEVRELVGKYNVVGTNQDYEETSYEGLLQIDLDLNDRIIARWSIGNHQQSGTGFFKNNILVINFRYKGADNKIFKGVVVYKCLSKDLLDGFWSEKHGDPSYLGSEQCFRINPKDTLIN
ncbi:hypothetical protein [Gaetbulibacter saemankumensis]|uniref:hypothetical protein n=1 Tax=Gaetbulibacter saemankumensis TaxID=311208 RepID=UPI000403EF32|nr:hypothetical protein [Gaetbulibacter saemankumensis]